MRGRAVASDKVEQVLAEVGVDQSHIDLFDGHKQGSQNWAHVLLDDESTIAQYSALFVNCGADAHDFGASAAQNVINNLATYVQNGGNLSVSDQAYEVIAATFPGVIDCYGSGGNNAANNGAVVNTESASVVDAQLASNRQRGHDRSALPAFALGRGAERRREPGLDHCGRAADERKHVHGVPHTIEKATCAI